MPMLNAVRISAIRREAEPDFTVKLAEQEHNRALRQALTGPYRDRQRT